MPPTLADRLVHILEAINDIQAVLSETTVERFAGDKFRRIFVERSFEIICEASRHIPVNVKAGEPEIDWQGMVDFGNRLRHAYHRIEANLLWQIAERDLPPLKAFIERIMRERG
ncbi:MAG TPA: HepT-like ribonuclease domain-containing protein [Xanthobacteraceae bacterium]|jgi:uncharacterized protein with HEPN domain